MNTEDAWDSEDWMLNARHLVEWVCSINSDRPLMLLIRHSHRATLQNHTEMVSAGLTGLGRTLAVEFGTRIPKGRPMHVFTSFVPRCFETAEAIAEGYTETGGHVVDIDSLPILVGPQIMDREVWKELHPNGENITEFVNRWANGEFKDRMESFASYQERLLEGTVTRLTGSAENNVYIHVTHDLALMSSKRMLHDRPLVFDDREPYLGGLGVTSENMKLRLFIASENNSYWI
ncbi:MAG: histidine phosphatase family protein [Promethearchaeota archaeon]